MEGFYEKIDILNKTTSMRFFHNGSDIPKNLVGFHWHDSFELLYIRKGVCRQKINGDTYTVHPGDVVFIRPGDVHLTDALSEKGCLIDVVQFIDSFLYDLGDVLDNLASTVITSKSDIYSRLFDAVNEYENGNYYGKNTIMAGLVQLIVGFLVKDCRVQTLPQISKEIFEVLQYLEGNEDITLNTVAKAFGYTPEHLSRKFHKETGVSFKERCQGIKMKRAIKLLGDGGLTLAAISEMLGYSDESSFIRAFKRTYGITPSAFARLRVNNV